MKVETTGRKIIEEKTALPKLGWGVSDRTNKCNYSFTPSPCSIGVGLGAWVMKSIGKGSVLRDHKKYSDLGTLLSVSWAETQKEDILYELIQIHI